MGMSVKAAKPRQYGLSKSKITAFEQCPKKLWLATHKRDEAIVDEAAEARFRIGHEVGDMACRMVPEGIMVDAEPDLAAAVARTRELLEGGWSKPIFEATFEHEGVLVRVDVLTPDGKKWSVAEVKSSTKVKDYHLGDLATQVWVMKKAGLKISTASIRHINNEFRLKKEGKYKGLLKDQDCLEAIAPEIKRRAKLVTAAREMLAGDEPDIEMGAQCTDPFECEFALYCSRNDPDAPEWPISELPRTGRQVAEIYAQDEIFDLRDVPEGTLANPAHERIRKAVVTGEVYRDATAVRSATKAWAWPRAYLDFETIGPAIPQWIGCKPYQQVPFQFSCHIQKKSGQVSHTGFLSIDGSDPRRGCAEALVDVLAGKRSGSIIAYNASFERRCVRELAEAFADLKPALMEIHDKIVDLLPITRDHYYHRDQRGSWSIKAVLPTVAPELAYDGLEVKDGGAAQEAWMEAAHPETTPERRHQLKLGLEVYCERDTQAMITLLQRLIED